MIRKFKKFCDFNKYTFCISKFDYIDKFLKNYVSKKLSTTFNNIS